uniref:Myosin IC heavy chain n=1 Tax=Acanthamoeba castellanii TaxID=5755 RepID=MYSC_ACACA|nr:RecName: Full=Myosin IC heavy chain [Acanthamoeba castellanii]AAA27707.1 myosin IB heavy chain [Acanthamoeba castellanii]
MAYTSKHGVDDMVMLTSISNDAINDNLKKRFAADLIYTYIGHVLISVNPYKQINNLYTERTLKDYRGKYRYELPPHVYALADDMYRTMLSESEDQCVIISGESGAGKTEASKKIMQYIAAVSGATGDVMRVKDVILEAFGNAKTIRNNNSSRFGKYMEIQFDLKGDPVGGRISNYLLEKSRVVYQTNGERNFHIFYQLLAARARRPEAKFGLQTPDYYFYLNQGKTYTVDGMDDNQEFQDTWNAMKVIGFTAEEQHEIFRLVTAILYLGNVQFVDDGKGGSTIADSRPVAVETALLYRTITTGEQGRGRSSVYSCPQDPLGAIYSRDALSKALYSRMFDYIIQRVNDAMYIDDPEALTTGILDIYGFEIFGKNGFEQLCINFVNEKLQQIFIQLTLKAEQEEYGAEGIQWENIDYFNNKICCDLIEEKRPPGLMTILDDVCNFPKGTDDKFREKLLGAFPTHAHLAATSQPDEFVIKHYAGDVVYNVDGFCDKNKDLLFKDLIGLAECTSSTFFAGLFPEAKEVATSKKKPTTAGFKIKESINILVATLSKCTPHYIRCIKPNEKKAANAFNNSLVLHQVKYLGLLENVRIRRAGYAYRQSYDKFFYRYRVVCPKTWSGWNGDMVSGAEAILNHVGMSLGKEYQKGKTKIFIRQPESVFSLEELRDRTVFSYANKIQRFLRKTAMRKYYYEVKKGGNDALVNKKERRRLSLERPFKTDYINYRQNFKLKDCIGDKGTEKVLFADLCNNLDKSFWGSKVERRIMVLTSNAMFLVAIDPNKDKIEKKVKPFLYVLKRRIDFNKIGSITLSPLQDNFMLISVNGEHSNLLECRRKTELIGVLLKHNPSVRIQFADTFNVTLKGGKTCVVKFIRDPQGGDGKVKGTKVSVAPGLPPSSAPNIQAPQETSGGASFTVAEQSYKDQILGAKGGGGGGGRGRGGPSPSGAVSPRPSPGGGGGGPSPFGGRPSPSGPPAAASAPGPEQARALYDFAAENPDELTFNEGAVVTVINKSNPDWWEGELNGQRGVFPASYVELIPRAAAPAPGPSGGPRPAPPGGKSGRAAPMGGPGPMRGRGGPAPGGPGRGGAPPPGAGRAGPPGGRGMPAPGGAAPRGRGAPPPGAGGPPGGGRGGAPPPGGMRGRGGPGPAPPGGMARGGMMPPRGRAGPPPPGM